MNERISTFWFIILSISSIIFLGCISYIILGNPSALLTVCFGVWLCISVFGMIVSVGYLREDLNDLPPMTSFEEFSTLEEFRNVYNEKTVAKVNFNSEGGIRDG